MGVQSCPTSRTCRLHFHKGSSLVLAQYNPINIYTSQKMAWNEWGYLRAGAGCCKRKSGNWRCIPELFTPIPAGFIQLAETQPQGCQAITKTVHLQGLVHIVRMPKRLHAFHSILSHTMPERSSTHPSSWLLSHLSPRSCAARTASSAASPPADLPGQSAAQTETVSKTGHSNAPLCYSQAVHPYEHQNKWRLVEGNNLETAIYPMDPHTF